MTTERFRPMAPGDIFDEAFDLYKTNFAFLLLTGALALVPLHIVTAVVKFRYFPDFSRLASGLVPSGDPMEALQKLVEFLGQMLQQAAYLLPLHLAGYGLAACALVSAASACYLRQPLQAGAVYRALLPRIVPITLTAFVWCIPVGLGYFVCVVPGLALLTYFLFTPQTFALEKKAYFSAMGRSWGLVASLFWRIAGVLLLLGLVTLILDLGFSYPFSYLVNLGLKATGLQTMADATFASHPGRFGRIIEELSDGLFALLMYPFSAVVMTVLYYDVRVRKEAFDVELVARQLGYRPLAECAPFLPPATPFGPVPVRPAAPRPPSPDQWLGGPPR
jgi:hypothetical protein